MTMLTEALLLFEEYTYLILFLWVLVESLGVPLAGEIVLLMAGSLTVIEPIHIFGLMLAGTSAAIIGDSLIFFLGRNFLENRFQQLLGFYCRYTVCSDCTFTKTERYFTRWGGLFIIFARFIMGVRVLAAPFSGMTRMPVVKFWFFDTIGLFLWTGFYLFVGRIFGRNWDFKSFSTGIIISLLTILFLVMVYKYIQRKKYGPTPVETDDVVGLEKDDPGSIAE